MFLCIHVTFPADASHPGPLCALVGLLSIGLILVCGELLLSQEL